VRDAATAPHRGVYEVTLRASALQQSNPWFDNDLRVTFTRPDGSQVTAPGFFDGGNVFKARAYCDAVGTWHWRSMSSLAGLDGKTGSFRVAPSELKGKLRIHPNDPRQFAFDNGQWFLHVGDTGYRYVTASEPKWKQYIDQAEKMGASKIRTWFCQARSDVQILFADKRQGLNLPYWQEIDRRLVYALNNHPSVILQLIPYGEDTQELRRYGEGDRAAHFVAAFAQARFSAFPNIYWCISNDRELVKPGTELSGRRVPISVIDRIGRDMAEREPWGTLLTNHQSRGSGFAFVGAPWADIVTIEDLDQVDGRILLKYRAKTNAPVVNDEDRYEHWRSPRHPRYFFRRLMWASLFSGGHATYGGLKTFEPYDGKLRGVQGYFDAVAEGKLAHGAEDFRRIHQFFKESELTLVGMTPDDSLVGDEPANYKCLHNEDVFLIYLSNPDGSKPEMDAEAKTRPAVSIELPDGFFSVRWYDPATGHWIEHAQAARGSCRLTAPKPGDWILVLRRPKSAAQPILRRTR